MDAQPDVEPETRSCGCCRKEWVTLPGDLFVTCRACRRPHTPTRERMPDNGYGWVRRSRPGYYTSEACGFQENAIGDWEDGDWEEVLGGYPEAGDESD